MKPPILKPVAFVPGTHKTRRKPRPTEVAIGLRYDMTQFYGMKATLEALFGRLLYMKLKETADLTDWRNATIRLLDAIGLAIKSTVTIADDEWREDIAAEIDHGKTTIKSSNTMSDLFAALSAVLTKIVFLQIGLMPSRTMSLTNAPLKAERWTLNSYRSVQYVQTAAQKQALNEARRRQNPH